MSNTIADLSPPRQRLASVPDALKRRPQWVLWKLESQRPNGPKTKVPYTVYNCRASTTNPATWATFDAVCEAGRQRQNLYSGVGYVFSGDDPFTGIDLDNSLDDAGQLLPWARELFDPTTTYGEVSPSGTGVKFVVEAALPGNGVNVKGFGPGGTGGVELYDRGRFFTITGRRYPECQASINPDGLAAVSLYHHVKPKRAPKPVASEKPFGNLGDRVARCTAYLEKCPDAISGDGGHNATFRAAMECFRFGLSDSEAWGVLLWFNANKTGGECWTEKELRHKLDSAKARVGDDAGKRLREERPDKSRPNGGARPKGHSHQSGKSSVHPLVTLAPGHSGELPPDGTVYVCAAGGAAYLLLAGLAGIDAAPDPAATAWNVLSGRDVVVLMADADAGTGFEAVPSELARLKPPPTIRVARLSNAATVAEFVDIVGAERSSDAGEAIATLAEAVPVMPIEDLIGGPVLIDLSLVTPREVQWLWPGRIPLGRMVLLVGMPGCGKSFLTCDAAARVTRGTVWPDGTPCPRGSVLFICAEDDPADTICPRLIAAGADMTRVKLLASVKRWNREAGKIAEVMFTLADVEALRAALARMPDCRLIVIDPIGSFLGGGVDAHRDNEVRSVLAPLSQLADVSGAAILVVAHRRKSAGTFADDTALGSRAFTGLARAVHHLLRDPNDKRRRLLLPGKNNLAEEGDGLAFSIGGDPPALAWEAEPVAMTADDAMAEEQKGGSSVEDENGQTKLEQAQHFLADMLRERPRSWADVTKAGKQAGHAHRTLERARTNIAETFKKGDGWFWRMKGDNRTDVSTDQVRHPDTSDGGLGEHGEVGGPARPKSPEARDLQPGLNFANGTPVFGEVEPKQPQRRRSRQPKGQPSCDGVGNDGSSEPHA